MTVEQALREPARLAALHETGLAGTPAEETFDRYTRLVLQALKCDVSLVTLLSEDVQYLKSALGMAPSACPTRRMPARQSLCQHVVAGGEPLIITDVREMPPFDGQDMICEWGIIAYLGAPLRTEDGFTLGSLCAIQKSPREWTPDDVELMRELAAAASSQIRLHTLGRALRESVEQLESTARERDEMLHMLVHDMRTPLSAVICALDLLDGEQPPSEGEKELLAAARGSGQQLLGMIDGMLASNRLDGEGGGLALEEVEAPRLVRHAYRMVSPLADSANVRVEFEFGEALPLLRVDREFVERMLLNLLTNAIKFSPSGDRVRITVKAEEAQPSTAVRFVVADNGPGVPEAERGTIFEKYQRGTARTEGAAASHGLGLHLCRRVAEAHGGTISVQEAPGGGAEFHVVLPSGGPRKGTA